MALLNQEYTSLVYETQLHLNAINNIFNNYKQSLENTINLLSVAMFDLNETISPSKDTEVKEILVSNQLRFEKEYEEVKDYFDNLNNQISKIKDFMKSDKFNEILEIQKINLIDELRLKENHVKHTKDYLNMLESRLHLKKKINIHN